MQLVFELSGEHETLPKAEVRAGLDASGVAYEELTFSDRLLLVEVPQLSPENKRLDLLSRRLGMTHRVYSMLGTSALDEKEILNVVKSVDLAAIMEAERTFAVRTRFLHKSSLYSRRDELLRLVGECITRAGCYTVDLKNPSKTFVLLLTAQKCFFCLLLHSVDKRQFEAKRPHFRPFFSPVVIMPKIARALVNLSGVNAAEVLLDPFCGTGGILLEAVAIGAEAIGADVQGKMVGGARENLEFFGLRGDLIVSDASEIPLRDNSIDAVVTDMPYGRASFVSGSSFCITKSRSVSIELLHQEALAEIHRVLKTGRKAVIVSNSPAFHSFARKYGFRLIEQHAYRVHKSLTRYITVLEKA
ncbi:MAG TPA: methyltransferase domain-containing protein [Desulfobacteria bacterium]|nr:methyltransferase domain-containing protein [Desulfobacteria bacterium]